MNLFWRSDNSGTKKEKHIDGEPSVGACFTKSLQTLVIEL